MPPSEYMDCLVALNSDLICFKIRPLSSHVFHASILIDSLDLQYEVIGNSKKEAAASTFVPLVDLLAELSAKITKYESINKSIFYEDLPQIPVGKFKVKSPKVVSRSQRPSSKSNCIDTQWVLPTHLIALILECFGAIV